MALLTSIMTGGVNNHPTTSEEANAWSTDFISEGIVGSFTGGPPLTGAYAVTAQGTPDMTVAVATGVCYVQGTPTSQSSQTFRVKHTASENVTISANSSGSTKYDWVYIKLDATKLNGPNVAGDDAATLVTSRSTSQSSDDGTPPTYGYPLAVITVSNGATSITSGNIRDSRANCIINLGSSSVSSGWTELGYAPNTVTALGNRSYSLVFNSTDLTGTTSVGQRLKLPRTVTAPTGSITLNGTTQYGVKSSPSGMTQTDSITESIWINPDQYKTAGMISRNNGTTDGWKFYLNSSGQIVLAGARAGDDLVTSYQSVPLNKWTHVSASINTTTTTGVITIDGKSVPVSYTNNANTGFATPTQSYLIGATNGASPTDFFSGQLAQSASYSAVIAVATILASMNQTLTGSETSLISAHKLDQSSGLTDLSANANNLTATGSPTYSTTKTPFTNPVTGTSVTAGTTNYGIITAQTFSTNTTYTVQVPEGETLPTTGGIGTVSYSTQYYPYGFPGENKLLGEALLGGSQTTTSGTVVQINGLSITVYVPAGKQVRLTAGLPTLTTSGANAIGMSIWDGTVSSGTRICESTLATTTASTPTNIFATGTQYPSAGSHTYNVGYYVNGGSTLSTNTTATTPSFLRAEIL